MALKTALLIPDTHRPHHHKKAYALMLRVAKSIKPDEIVILGDYADFYSVSSHDKDPRVDQSLIEEVEDVNRGLDELDKLFPRAKKVFIEGNHCYRLERFICHQAPSLFGVTDLKFLFKFNQRRNWHFVKYGPNQNYYILNSYLRARHEPLGSSAKATAAKALCSLVYGHIHRIEESHLVGLDGKNHVCFSVGWLGDKRKEQVFGYTKQHQQWQLGFGLVTVDDKTGLFYHQKIHILEHGKQLSCVVNGRRFVG